MASTDNLVVARFRVHSKINKALSKEAGRPIYEDTEVCEIKFSGNKQTVGVYPAHEVFKTIQNPQTGENEQMTWALAYKDQYLAFKNNEAQDMAGTPLHELPFLTQSKRLELKALNIHTAESLAAIDGQPLKRLGMNGRELKNQAQAYLDNAAGSVDVVKLAAINAELQARIAVLEANSAPSAQQTTSVSPFQDWEVEDIKNWIAEQTGERPKGNPNHATLVARADAVNADLAKKAQQAAA